MAQAPSSKQADVNQKCSKPHLLHTLPPRDLRLRFPRLIPANRFRLKLVAPALNWYPGWGSNPQDFRR